MGMIGGIGGGGTELVATANVVYVLRGNQLLAFKAGTLEKMGEAMLPGPPGGPGGPGGPGPGGAPPPRPEPNTR
jgi:hypothetical protein